MCSSYASSVKRFGGGVEVREEALGVEEGDWGAVEIMADEDVHY